MAAMAPDDATITFQNTGREDEKTLEFVRDVGDALDREIVWLEFRPPKRPGAPPREFLWERVDFASAHRRGEPFAEMMQAINAYRAACGKGTVAPHFRGRICTTHLKHRVLDHYLRSRGIYAHDRLIGLRADEPNRVAGLRRQETMDKGLIAPLYEAGVTKEHVLEFWARQPFDLDLPEYRGNCDGCFLKDQSDVSRAIGGRPSDVSFWAAQQDAYARFGGSKWPSYRALADELPTRLAIETSLRAKETPVDDGRMDPRRFRLVVTQEKKRIAYGPSQVSCACESATDSDDSEDEADDAIAGVE